MERPFIILNSGTVESPGRRRAAPTCSAHELGHILSDHVLYRTMTILLLQLATLGFPIVGLAARALLVALLEWYRKSELSSDRAGLLAVQDPEVAMRAMLKMAGGRQRAEETSLQEFIQQAEEYRTGGDVADQVYKILNLIGATHPFWVLRLSEVPGAGSRAVSTTGSCGANTRVGASRTTAYQDDLREAAEAYAEGARDISGPAWRARCGAWGRRSWEASSVRHLLRLTRQRDARTLQRHA